MLLSSNHGHGEHPYNQCCEGNCLEHLDPGEEISFLDSVLGGGIKSSCLEWKKDIKEYTETNPAITGNYSDFNDPVFQEWAKKGDDINKRLFDSLGIKYHSIESWDTGNTTPNQILNRTKENMTGMMEAMKKCYNAGVDFGGMKELKEFSKGLN